MLLVVEDAPAWFFERFRKRNATSNSLGFGLFAVRQIGCYYAYAVSYSFASTELQHTLRVNFRAPPAGSGAAADYC